ncbi:XRE family transcriptional regulator [Bradyrhizobium nanningense]|uniref:XRE family transcriptional regulator n=1 Tax=Bradyrhizobium nanningense TaxID=1325118 RepID=A0A4Q0S3G9_9BRAD|nr:addiction module antidote protein, HigA family [Bradyrhizobium nanningense]RXH21880.1 XRE family transcriptional regulator [Bradyrhizobium nanningense]RXH26637.1 XRE family transcriptional regulator [Bradyrhizobium nanningense]
MTLPLSRVTARGTSIHPGGHLAEELRELGITADPALRLGHWFGTSPQFWMNLPQQYELRLAEKEVGAQLASLPRRANAQSTRKLGKTA